MTKCVANKPYERAKTKTEGENKENIVVLLGCNRNQSVRQLAAQLNDTSATSVWRVLQREKFNPYKLTIHHKLHKDDYDRRFQFR